MRIYLGCMVALSALAACTMDDFGDDDLGGGGGASGTGTSGGDTTPPTDDCPGSSLCSPTGPATGLEFSGAAPVLGELGSESYATTHNHILAGGTDDITLLIANTNGATFLAPYQTQTTPPLVVTSTDHEVVHLTETDGTGELKIINPNDGLLYDTYHYASSSIGSAQAVSQSELITSPDWLFSCADAYAFWPGDLEVGVALWGTSGHRLIDTSLTLEADVANAEQMRWDQITLPSATVGTHTITIASGGGMTTTAQVHVVDQADTIGSLVNTGGLICFGAYSNQTFIAGAPFVFTVDGVTTPFSRVFGANCVDAPAGSTIVAVVPGASLTVIAGTGAPQREVDIDHRLAELRAARAAVQ